MRSLRNAIVVVLAMGMALLAGTSGASAASPALALHQIAVAQTVELASSTTVTKSCSTGGYWYMTDTMYVSRTYISGGKYQYKVTRSPNRTLTVNISGTYHYVSHTAVALNQYSHGTVYHKSYPATTVYLYSQYSTDDFGLWYDVTDHATLYKHTGCYVYF